MLWISSLCTMWQTENLLECWHWKVKSLTPHGNRYSVCTNLTWITWSVRSVACWDHFSAAEYLGVLCRCVVT